VKRIKVFIPFLGLFLLLLVACELDPWTLGSNSVNTDLVVIKKVTAYGTQIDGVSPYKGQVGAVTMSHKVHEKEGIGCTECHHKEHNDDRIKECAKCHNGYKGYDTMHGLCVDCHIAKARGPQKCMQCH